MAGRPHKPIAAQETSRRVHRSGDELRARRDAERPRGGTSTEPPQSAGLTGPQAERFRAIADELDLMGAWSVMLADELARYVVEAGMYETITARLGEALASGDMESAHDLQLMQDKAYRHAHASAGSLGLTAPSRCALAAANQPEECDVLDV